MKLKKIVNDNYVPAFNGKITPNPSRFEAPLIAPPPPAERDATEFMKEKSAPEPQDQVAPRPLTVPGTKAPIVIESPSPNKAQEVAPPPPAEPSELPLPPLRTEPTLLPPSALRSMDLSPEQLKTLGLQPSKPPVNKATEPEKKPLLVPNEGLSKNTSETSLGGLETQGLPAKPVAKQSGKPVRR